MAKVFLLGAAALLAACQAQTLTQGERDYALSALHASRKLFLDSVEGLSDAQLRWKPDARSWSVMEVAEHIVASEEFLAGVAQKALQAPADPSKKQPKPREMDAKILAAVADRSQKAQAPEGLVPKGRFRSIGELTAEFRRLRDRNIAFVRETSADLRSHFAPSPMGDLDALQWYIFLAGHTERHVAQIQELKSNPGFPKK
ncbi:MAG: DinB family protein [Bryobacteraceae bacterium]|nr:DinB family protein [Bryobacteraceae bacterium]MCX7602900.1 DinB family protein [Bryobacteraceae bacterium]